MNKRLSNDSKTERLLRLGLLASVLLFGTSIILNRYVWARLQNGGPGARTEELVVYAVVPIIALCIGWLIKNYRILSWGLTCGATIGILTIVFRAYQDVGEAWTRATYSEWFLEAHLSLCAYYIMAIIALVPQKIQLGLRTTSKTKMVLALLLTPMMFYESMALALI